MKELKILVIVIVFSLLTYFLVEPFAHSQMHKHVEFEGFEYKDLAPLTKTGNVANGKDLVMGAGACVGCHSIKAEGIPPAMDPATSASSYGVNPPDLSNVGAVYDVNFLSALIKNPAHALKLEHKFNEKTGKTHPMAQFYGAGGDIDQEVADMIAYLQSIAPKKEELTPTIAFETACGRCHAVRYENWTQMGTKPKFKKEQESLEYDIQLLNYQDSLKSYLGKLPPDLSMYIRSRSEHYLKTFIENPQSQLAGTAMPRVGVTAEAADKVIEYLADSGDTKRAERESVGIKVMLYLLVFALIGILWKKEVWRDLH